MITDPVVEQLHRQREEYMEQFQYDFDAVVRDIKAHEASGQTPLLEPPESPLPEAARQQRTRFTRR